MKNILPLCASLSLFSSLVVASVHSADRRSNRLLRFIAQQASPRDFALHQVIGARCNRYLPQDRQELCQLGVKKLISALDYDVLFSDNILPPWNPNNTWTPSSFVFVAFKSNLIELLSNSRTEVFLDDLNQELYRFISGNKRELNIWSVTKKYFRTDHDAAQVMAALFQDTSSRKLHLAYLETAGTEGSEQFQSNKELLSRVIDTINLVLDMSEDNYRMLFYPRELQQDLNRNIYHFYVPLYLAKALAVSGHPADIAVAAPLMLTLSYEFLTSSQDYRYVFSDPETVTLVSKVKDIYAGYAGARLGIRGMGFIPFERVRSAFERSSREGVTLLLAP
jgi:hypothetical protein